jgi:GNAT superfamily N-acetyltransferase
LPKRIGRGIGRALFDHAVRRAASLGAGSVRIEADPYAEGFYRRMGARWVGEIS